MVDFIITDFSNVRGGGNIVDTVPSAEDFIVDNCTISSSSSGVFVLTPGESLVGTVSLLANHTSITVGQSVVFSATVEDTDGEPLEGLTVSFYRDGVSLGSGVSDDSGLVQLTVSSWSSGSFTCTASCQGVTSSAVTVTVNKITSTISLSAVSSTISVGDTPQLTGTLSVGSGESVKIYLGDVLVDTVTTGTNGAFNFTGSATSTSGSLTFKAVYDGDSTHSSVTSSNVVITVSDVTPVVSTVSLSSDKSILSAYNSESAVLSATVLDGSSNPMSGETVTFYNGSTSMGTATTNSSGIATKSYSATGAGDVTFTASAGEVTTATEVTIEDCRYWNDGSSTNGLEIPSGASVTSDGSYLTIASTSSEKIITLPVTLTNSEDWEFSLKLALKQDNKTLGLIFNDNTYYMSTNSSVGNYYVYFTSNIYSEVYSATGDVIVVTRKNGTTTVKVNGTQIASKTTSHKSSFKCGFYTFNKPQYVDDLKIKAI